MLLTAALYSLERKLIMKFTKKLKATIITFLALITMTSTVSIIELIIVNVKAKTFILKRNHSLKNSTNNIS